MGSAVTSDWLGVGLYSLPEAARLAQVPTNTVRRWLQGYRFRTLSGRRGASSAIFEPELRQIDGCRAIGFHDLVELLFIKAFRDHGVGLPVIRRAAREAARRWDTTHPFCERKFATDGLTIFSTIRDEFGEEEVLDLPNSQYVFESIIRPYLKQLDYAASGDVNRWWPLGKKGAVLVDPRRAFGKPVLARYGVPTGALYAALEAGQTELEAAQWYDVPVSAVRAALRFEKGLAA